MAFAISAMCSSSKSCSGPSSGASAGRVVHSVFSPQSSLNLFSFSYCPVCFRYSYTAFQALSSAPTTQLFDRRQRSSFVWFRPNGTHPWRVLTASPAKCKQPSAAGTLSDAYKLSNSPGEKFANAPVKRMKEERCQPRMAVGQTTYPLHSHPRSNP